MDSICSAFCYADLKRRIDSRSSYQPVRCGPLTKGVKQLFEREGITPPPFQKDLYPRIRDIVKTDYQHYLVHDPLLDIIKLLNERTLSVTPVFHGDGSYAGLLSVDEVSSFFIKEHVGDRPRYHFVIDNFSRVIPGEWIQEGSRKQFKAPLMTGAMPSEISRKRIEALLPDKPVMVVGMRKEIVDMAVEMQFPALILTGYEPGERPDYDFSSYQGAVCISHLDTAETIRRLRLSLPIENLLTDNIPRVQADDLFDDVKQILVSSEYRGLPVFEGDRFCGFVTRRCFIDRPKKQVIMTDHNEPDQSIWGIEDAEVVEILDHHRFAAEKTRYPIYISSAPVGSTCTIVHDHYRRSGITPERSIARLLLAGILSDTVLLKSPTTTPVDREAVSALTGPAELEDPIAYGQQMFSAGLSLTDEDPRELILSDFKVYGEFGCRFAIGQVEVVTLEEAGEVKDALLEMLGQVGERKGLDWVMLLITDVIKEKSLLLSSGYELGEKRLSYRKLAAGLYDLPGVLSRKKQLLPEILRVLEEHQHRGSS